MNFTCFRLGERQIKNLLKIAAFSKDKSLKETSQAEMKKQCLQLWKVCSLYIFFNILHYDNTFICM